MYKRQDAYGDSQEVLRNYNDQSSVQFQIMSKFIDDGSNTFMGFFNNSLNRLNRQSLKGYYFHRFEDYKKFQSFKEVEELKAQNKLELFGVSLYSTPELREVVADPRIDLIQLPFNALDNSQEKRDLLTEAHRQGKKIYIRSAFLQGVLVMPEDKIPAHLNPLKKDLQSLKAVAANAGLSMQELCLGYLNSKSFIDGILIGVDNVDQLKTNINLSKVSLSKTVIDSIEQIVVQDQDLLNPAKWGK